MGMVEFWYELAQGTVKWFNEAAKTINERDGYYHIKLIKIRFDEYDYTYIVYEVSFDGTTRRKRTFECDKYSELISYLDGLCDAIMMF